MAGLRWAVIVAVVVLASGVHGFDLFCGRRNCFEVLGLNRSASKAEIKRAYRTLALDLHPDKNASLAAEETFRAVTTAYEILKEPEKREEYEDFLDNPTKYYWYYATSLTREYAKADVKAVVVVLLILFSVLHWANMSLNYRSAQRRVRESAHFKKQAAELVASGQAQDAAEAESMINVEVVGSEKPHWKRSLPILLAKFPFQVAKFLYWVGHWIVAYRWLKRDYTYEDKEFLVRQELDISARRWLEIPEDEREEMIERKLWIKKNLEEFMLERRVQSNRKGLRKRPRRRREVAAADDFVE